MTGDRYYSLSVLVCFRTLELPIDRILRRQCTYFTTDGIYVSDDYLFPMIEQFTYHHWLTFYFKSVAGAT